MINDQSVQPINNNYVAYIAIALANLGPLLGVLMGEWTPFEVVFMYWFENLVIGLFVIARMIFKPRGGIAFMAGGIAMSLFFCVHYGLFTWAHGFFVMELLGEGNTQVTSDAVFSSALQYISDSGLKWVALSMLLAHAALYMKDYVTDAIGPVGEEMRKPYNRIIVLHIAIIAGGGLAMAWPSGAFLMMLLLIAFKTFNDIKQHKKEREELALKAQNQPIRIVDQIIAQLEDDSLDGQGAQATMELNGQTMSFATWTEMRDSPQFEQMKRMARLFMSKKDIQRLEQALENKIAREEGHSGVILDGEAEHVPENIKQISAEVVETIKPKDQDNS